MSVFDAAIALQWGGSPFRGADITRLSADRLSSANSPNSEVTHALRPLRARARDLVRNNAYAAGIVESFAANIVGEHGIRLKSRLTNPRNDPKGAPDQAANWEIERAWKDWGCEYATVDGLLSWLEFERLVVKSWATDGEVFVRRRRGFANPYGFAVEMLDPDQLDETMNVPARNGRNEIVMGIEIDANGRRVAFHFWDRHPDDPGKKLQRIAAEDISQHFVPYRAGQQRGYSPFAPVLTTVEMIDGYTEAELVAARIGASQMGFITNNTPEAIQAYATRLNAQNQQGTEPQPRQFKVSPGGMRELIPGQGFEQFDPNHPADAFDPFLSVLLRGVARGFSMSYLTATGDVSAANYSSMRAGLLPERDQWRILQAITAQRVHRPVYRDWIKTSLLTGAVKLPTPIAADYYGVEWRGRRWDWVDPRNDIEAAEAAIHLGITSRQRIASDRGLDYETVIDESAEDQKYAAAAKVWIGGAGGLERVKVEAEDPLRPEGSKPSKNGNGKNPEPSANGNGTHNRIAEVL